MDTETSEAQEWLLESSQHLRDFKLAIEFKHLMTHAPGGIHKIRILPLQFLYLTI